MNTSSPNLPLRRPNRRLHVCLAIAILAHFLLFAPSLLHFSCTHDRPLGVPGGSGDSIAKGTVTGQLNATGKENASSPKRDPNPPVIKARMEIAATVLTAQKQRARRKFMERFSPDGLRALLLAKDNNQVRPDPVQQTQSTIDAAGTGPPGPPGPLGLERGQGSGNTASGSPFGDRINAPLWLYRVKYSGDWDANPKALPALLREVKLAINIKNIGSEEVVKLSDLPDHRGPNMPSMLFITGTGPIQTSDADRSALRDYLLGGGLLIADSSGGNFEAHFTRLMAQVLPGKAMRNIEHDHEVYRGRGSVYPYQMPRGCPIYRDHGSNDAKGIFDDTGRMMVFFSPGDMGSAWAVVDLGRKRGDVEASFQMGTNLVAYSLLHVRDLRK